MASKGVKYVGIFLLSLAACFILFLFIRNLDESRFRSKLGEEYSHNFSAIRLILDDYYKECKRFPTTEEGLNKLSTRSDCWPKAELIKKYLPEDSQEVVIIYQSDGSRYRLSMYRSDYGLDRLVEAPK